MADAPEEPLWTPRRSLRARSEQDRLAPVGDLALALVLLGVAALAAWRLHPGPLRTALTLPALAVVPGYVLLQAAIVPARPPVARLGHALFALGLSPAYLALAALTTTFAAHGFRAGPILGVAFGGTAILAAAAIVRRRAWRQAEADAIERRREERLRRPRRRARGTRPAREGAAPAPPVPQARRVAAAPAKGRPRDPEPWQSR